MNKLKRAAHMLGKFPLVSLYKTHIIDSVIIARREGIRELIRKRGKKVLLFVVAYYTVRDTLVYIILPLCIAKGIF